MGEGGNRPPQQTVLSIPPRITLVYWASGSGIAKDVALLRTALNDCGVAVDEVVTRWRKSRRERLLKALWQLPRYGLWPRPIQIHIEQIHREQFRYARQNFIIPNPELTDPAVFGKIDRPYHILCKSNYATELFAQMNLCHSFLGFTSEDRILPGSRKDYRKCLHVAGKSRFKGTQQLVETWQQHPDWPTLTLVQSTADCYGDPIPSIPSAPNIDVIQTWIPDEQLKQLQNEAGIHLCLSEMEGFGHYINEALSTGAIVLTTDAPPMNELVSEACGFRIAADPMPAAYMGGRWQFRRDELEAAMIQLLAQPPESLEARSRAARACFLERNTAFRKRVRAFIDGLGEPAADK